MARKTATIERFHLYGTPRYNVRLCYRGTTLHHTEGTTWVLYQGLDAPDVVLEYANRAKRRGFTHVKFEGDWSRAAKPKGGAAQLVIDRLASGQPTQLKGKRHA